MKNAEKRKQEFNEKVAKKAEKKGEKDEEKRKRKTGDGNFGEDESVIEIADDARAMKRHKKEMEEQKKIKREMKREMKKSTISIIDTHSDANF